MKSKMASNGKKPYRSPHLVKHGRLAQITRGGGGTKRDGSGGAPKTKASGSA